MRLAIATVIEIVTATGTVIGKRTGRRKRTVRRKRIETEKKTARRKRIVNAKRIESVKRTGSERMIVSGKIVNVIEREKIAIARGRSVVLAMMIPRPVVKRCSVVVWNSMNAIWWIHAGLLSESAEAVNEPLRPR